MGMLHPSPTSIPLPRSSSFWRGFYSPRHILDASRKHTLNSTTYCLGDFVTAHDKLTLYSDTQAAKKKKRVPGNLLVKCPSVDYDYEV